MFLYQSVFVLLTFICGTIFGSFLNVVIYRMGSGVGYFGRSKCLSCGKTLTPSMLVPVFSFLFARGRCRYCGVKLSWQYPLVETAAGVLFLAVLWVTGFDSLHASLLEAAFFALETAIWMTLLTITVYDLKHKIIPDRLSLLLAVLACAVLLLRWNFGLLTPHFVPFLGEFIPLWVDLLAGPLLFLPFALLWLFSGGRAMGLGDAKLALGLGWFLGFSGGVTAIILAFWIAFFPSLFLLFLSRKHFTMKSEIPFAPFLILGALLVFVWGIDILGWAF